MEESVSIKILMDLPKGVDPEIIDKIGEYMPLDLFFDGLIDYVYNDCMRNMMDIISMASAEIANEDLRKEREDALMGLINDHIQGMVEAFRNQLLHMSLYFTGDRVGKYVIEQVAYDKANETVAALVVLREEEELGAEAGELIDEENEEDTDEAEAPEGDDSADGPEEEDED